MVANLHALKVKPTNHPNKRPLGDYLGDVFNVRGFGAVANGITDDQPAIQAAVNACLAAGGGTVYFPLSTVGGYRINAPITFNNDSEVGIRFLGEMKGTQILGSFDGFLLDRSLAIPNNTLAIRIIERLYLSNSGANGGCIRLGSSVGAVVRDCEMGGHICITSEDAPGISAASMQVLDCIMVARGNFVGANGVIIGGGGTIMGCDVHGQNVAYRVYGDGVHIGGGRIERSNIAHLYGLDSADNDVGLRGLSVIGHTFEGNWTAIDFAGTTSGFTLSGLYVLGHGYENAGPVSSDDKYVRSQMDLTGLDGGTTFLDNTIQSPPHRATKTWTAAGAAHTDTAETSGGVNITSSLKCVAATGDWISTPDHADFAFGSGDFTIDVWFKCDAIGGVVSWMAGQQDSAATATSRSFRIGRNASNLIEATVTVGSTDTTVTSTTQYTNLVNTGWHYLALVRSGTNLHLLLDGVLEDTDTVTGTINNSSNNVRIGAAGEVTTNTWTGWFNLWRYSPGIARWTADFHETRAHKATGYFTGADSPANMSVQRGIYVRANKATNGLINGVDVGNWHEDSCFDIEDSTNRANIMVTGAGAAGGVGGGVGWRHPTKCHSATFMNNDVAPTYTFASLPTVPIEGEEWNITDSTTAAWGANVTIGGGLLKVLVRWNGANWTVVGK